MTDAKKPTPKKPFVPASVAPRTQPKRDADAELVARVLEVADDVFNRYVWGESYEAIASSLPFKIAGWKLRTVLRDNAQTAEQYTMIGIERSHNLIDAAIDYGRAAAAIGDASGYRVAVDVNLKVAAKLNVRDYGDKSKVELTGKDGGALEVKADLTLSAAEAYERLVRGS